MQQGLTDVVVVLDRSGSMEAIRSDMEGALGAFVREQRGVAGEAKMSLYQFDDQFETVFEARPIEAVSPITLLPRGSTALLDAVARTIVLTAERYRRTERSSRPETVIFVIISDGEENASREFTAASVQRLIKTQRSVWSWEFVFLGANQDAFREAQSIGIGEDSVMSFQASAEGVTRMGEDLSAATTRRRTSGNVGDRFFLHRPSE